MEPWVNTFFMNFKLPLSSLLQLQSPYKLISYFLPNLAPPFSSELKGQAYHDVQPCESEISQQSLPRISHREFVFSCYLLESGM